MKVVSIIFFIGITTVGVGQNIDSLKQVVEQTPRQEQFELILNYMRSLMVSDLDGALEVSNFAIEFAHERGDSLLVTRACYAQGFLLRRNNNTTKAIESFLSAYNIANRNKLVEELPRITNSLAIAHTFIGNYDQALKFHFESLVINENAQKHEDVGISLNNIGIVYFKLKNYQKALEYYDKSLKIKSKISSSYDLDRLYINMALCYNQLKEYDTAEDFINKGLAVCKSACSDAVLMEANLGLGVSYIERGKLKESEVYFLKSLDISRKLKDQRFEIENLTNMAALRSANNETESAINLLKEAEVIALSTSYSQPLMEVYKKLGSEYSKTKNYEQSSIYSQKYSSLRDSILSEDLMKNMGDVQTKFAERENLSTIADNEKVIRAQRKLNYAVALIIIMAFGFIYLVMRNSRTIRRLNSRLSLEVMAKTEEITKSNHALKQVNDELDNLVYKTSHDIRGPLATLKGICNIALVDVKDEAALSFLSKLDITSSQLNLVLDKFSRVNEIYNTVISPKPVNIREIVNEIILLQQKNSRPKRIDAILEIEPIEEFETEPQLFYYTINSIIDNAFRYYNESQRVESFVQIKVERKRDDVIIRVIDNGVGIPINIDSDSLFHMFTRGSERSLTGGMGLFIASTAVRRLQGEIRFQRSADFILTEFIVQLPVRMNYLKIEKPKQRGKILPATTELIETLLPHNQSS